MNNNFEDARARHYARLDAMHERDMAERDNGKTSIEDFRDELIDILIYYDIENLYGTITIEDKNYYATFDRRGGLRITKANKEKICALF